MGCGCSDNRSIKIANSNLTAENNDSPERYAYLDRKRDLLIKYADSLFSSDIHDHFINIMSKDCQGFILTATGGEVTLIKDLISIILNEQIPPLSLIEHSLLLIHNAVFLYNKLKIVHRFDRFR